MEVKSAYANALSGIQRGLRGLDENTFEVAHAAITEGEGDVAQPLVESQINKTQVQVNAKVISILDETLGSLFDGKA